MLTFILLIFLFALADDGKTYMGGRRRRRRRRDKRWWDKNKEWLDPAWFHDHHQKL